METRLQNTRFEAALSLQSGVEASAWITDASVVEMYGLMFFGRWPSLVVAGRWWLVHRRGSLTGA